MRQSVKIFMLFARAGKCICDKYKDELLNVMTPPTTYPKINEKGDQMINLHHTNIQNYKEKDRKDLNAQIFGLSDDPGVGTCYCSILQSSLQTPALQ